MIKFTQIYFVALLLLFANSAKAGLILTDLPENNFIEYADYTAYDNFITFNGIDWTWASPVSQGSVFGNTLSAPTLHDGWDFATDSELSILRNSLNLNYFTKKDAAGNVLLDNLGNKIYIHSVEYWNTFFVDVTEYTNLSNFVWSSGVSSQWSTKIASLETFYVRRSPAAPVPEPSTLAIFAIALFALARKAKKA